MSFKTKSGILGPNLMIREITLDCLEEDEFLQIPVGYMSDLPSFEQLLKIKDDIDTFLHLINREEIEKHNDQLWEKHKEFENRPKTKNKKTRYTEGLVYLLKSKKDNVYKIGVTTNINKRLPQIATKLPFEIKLEHKIKHNAIYKLEKFLHEKFDDKRLNGEWFRLNDEDVKYIKEEAKYEEVI